MARGSVIVEKQGYEPEGRGFEITWGELLFFN
jgi:hypothetical protein